MSFKYEDIIGHMHHVSTVHPQMSAGDRAAQFAPFAALTGHYAALHETERLTDEAPHLDGDQIRELNKKLAYLEQELLEENRKYNYKGRTRVKITSFVPDEKKVGGSYRSYTGMVRKLDSFSHTVIMSDDTNIPMEHIVEIEISDESEEW